MNKFIPYFSYPNLDINKASLEDCISADEKIKDIVKQNKDIKKHNDEVIAEFRNLFVNRGKKKDKTDYAWFTDALSAMGVPRWTSPPALLYAKDNSGTYITVNDVYRVTMSSELTFENVKRTLIARNQALAAAAEKASREKALSDAWITSEALSLGISADDFTSTKDFVAAVNEASREKWIDENYPPGTEMDIKCCDECSTWTVGQRRCECGNRRIELCVERMGDSWYAWAEPW